jgi:hypothetical protein
MRCFAPTGLHYQCLLRFLPSYRYAGAMFLELFFLPNCQPPRGFFKPQFNARVQPRRGESSVASKGVLGNEPRRGGTIYNVLVSPLRGFISKHETSFYRAIAPLGLCFTSCFYSDLLALLGFFKPTISHAFSAPWGRKLGR